MTHNEEIEKAVLMKFSRPKRVRQPLKGIPANDITFDRVGLWPRGYTIVNYLGCGHSTETAWYVCWGLAGSAPYSNYYRF